MRIFLGFLMIVIGALLVMKANWIVQNFGYSEFAETKMRTLGGTRLMWKLIGIIVIIAGFFVVTDLYGDVLLWAFSPFLGGLRQSGL